MWPPTITPCECSQAGWCERHHCWKPPAMHLLCRRQIKYYEAWEQGSGPCLPDPSAPPLPSEETETGENPPGQAQPAGPSLTQRAMNLGRAVVRHAADRGQNVADDVYEARLEICRNCSMCDAARMVCLHPSCGCFLNVKARWQSEDCPLKKWPASPTEASETL